jgi:hypothetical protein
MEANAPREEWSRQMPTVKNKRLLIGLAATAALCGGAAVPAVVAAAHTAPQPAHQVAHRDDPHGAFDTGDEAQPGNEMPHVLAATAIEYGLIAA